MKQIFSACLAASFVLIASCVPPTVEKEEEAVSAVEVHKVDITPDPQFKPRLHITLPDSCPVPDGMTIEETTGKIYLNVPNFAPRGEDGKKTTPALLCVFDKEKNFEVLLEYPVHEKSGEIGPMGLDFGPDGNLYVCDNQFFTPPNATWASRILRVEMKDGKPTGKVETVVEGLRLANAILFHDGYVYVSDTNLAAPEDCFGCGCIWRFTQDELVGATETIKVDPTIKDKKPVDSHVWVVGITKKIGRGDNSGFDGIAWAWGALYTGNFGDGVMYRVEPAEAGSGAICDGILFAADDAKVQKVLDDETLHCCDGIFYDSATDKIYINDSQANAIRTLNKNHVANWLWVNDDTNGDEGLLDQPAECVAYDGVLYIANFDWAFPGLKNTTSVDKPYTISAIEIGVKSDDELVESVRPETQTVDTPAEAPAVEVPAEVPSEAPAETPEEVPAEVPAEAPAE
ncbi:MAG: hypothetical protein Q4D38_00790 [Planctomycetia bacterium]|nr:hypothetical protein [Planctomycetia bacterium]